MFEQGETVMKRKWCGIGLILLLAGPVWAQEPPAVQAVTLVRSGSSWDGAPLPDYEKGKPEITILRITIPPKATLPLHKHPVINAGVLLRGELTVVTANRETLHLKAGDPIVEVVGKWHYGVNEGSDPAEIIVFYAGVQGGSITIKK